MELIEEMRLKAENLEVVNNHLKRLEKIEWRQAMNRLVNGGKIFKVEKIDDRYVIVMYQFREEEYEHQFGRKTEVRHIREFNRQKAYSNDKFNRLSDSNMGILEFASHDWYKEMGDYGVGRFS